MQDRKRDTDVQTRFLDSYGRRWGWDDLREQHQNMYIIKCETDCQSRWDAWDKCSGLVRWWPRGMGWGGRWEGESGWGTHLNPWLIHVNVWQKPVQYCKVISLQLIKINWKKRLTALILQSKKLPRALFCYHFYNIIDREPCYFPLVVSFIILNSSWENSAREASNLQRSSLIIFLHILIWMLKGQGVWILVYIFGLILKWSSVFRR